MPIRDALLPEFDHEMATTRRVLERVPDDHLDFKPHETSHTLGWMASHIAQIPYWGTTTLEQEGLDFGDNPPRFEGGSRQEILDHFDENVKRARKALEGASDETMHGTWTLRNGDQVIFSQPRAGVFRGFVMSHLIHHRAQLAVYYRMLGVPVPSIYGPSGDENIFAPDGA